MPRLRMKASTTTSAQEEAILAATRKAQKRSHQRRHHRRDKKDDEPSRRRLKEESLTPPRQSTSKHTLDHDESALPPSQAYKQAKYHPNPSDDDDDSTRYETMRDHQIFMDKLHSANLEDMGSSTYYEQTMLTNELNRYATGFQYGSSVRNALGREPDQGPSSLMDEEEYAEYIRAGMWRLRNKEEFEMRERLEKENKAKAEKDRIENERLRRLEAERIKKLESRRKKKDQQLENDQRQEYHARWIRINAHKPTEANPKLAATTESTPATTGAPLRFSDLPWPIFPPVPFPPLSWPNPSDFNPESIEAFLFETKLDKPARKMALRSAVLAYHPDRFDRVVARLEGEQVKERTRELGLRLSQTLNEMMKTN